MWHGDCSSQTYSAWEPQRSDFEALHSLLHAGIADGCVGGGATSSCLLWCVGAFIGTGGGMNAGAYTGLELGVSTMTSEGMSLNK